jgi:hypothetical protein
MDVVKGSSVRNIINLVSRLFMAFLALPVAALGDNDPIITEQEAFEHSYVVGYPGVNGNSYGGFDLKVRQGSTILFQTQNVSMTVMEGPGLTNWQQGYLYLRGWLNYGNGSDGQPNLRKIDLVTGIHHSYGTVYIRLASIYFAMCEPEGVDCLTPFGLAVDQPYEIEISNVHFGNVQQVVSGNAVDTGWATLNAVPFVPTNPTWGDPDRDTALIYYMQLLGDDWFLFPGTHSKMKYWCVDHPENCPYGKYWAQVPGKFFLPSDEWPERELYEPPEIRAMYTFRGVSGQPASFTWSNLPTHMNKPIVYGPTGRVIYPGDQGNPPYPTNPQIREVAVALAFKFGPGGPPPTPVPRGKELFLRH